MNSDNDIDILIIGGESIIGEALAKRYKEEKAEVWITTRNIEKINTRCLFFDLRHNFPEQKLPEGSIKVAFICAAITSISQCNAEPEKSRLVNVENTVSVIKQLLERGTFTVFLSTSAVFDGELPFSKINEPTKPRTIYGQQKAETEASLLAIGSDRLAIVRLSKVIYPNMPLVISWINNLKSGTLIRSFSDMVIAPVSLDLVLLFLGKIADLQIPGIHHLSSSTDISYYNAALHIADVLEIDQKLIEPDSYKNAGIEWTAKNATLDCQGLQNIGLDSPSPFEALNSILHSYLSGTKQ